MNGRCGNPVLPARNAFHHGSPWPSIVPPPLISRSCALSAVMLLAYPLFPFGYREKSLSILMVASFSTLSRIPLPSANGPVRYCPAGTSTVPPPAAVQAATAFSKALVFNVVPSGLAPKSVILKTRGGITGRAGSAFPTAKQRPGARSRVTTAAEQKSGLIMEMERVENDDILLPPRD